MAVSTIDPTIVPDFKYSGMYYRDLLGNLEAYYRENLTEISDFNDYEPFVQLIKGFVFEHHLISCMVDIAAEESLYGTAKMRDSVNEQLKLIESRLLSNVAATTDMVAQLTKTFTTDVTTLIPKGAIVSQTNATADELVEFEANADVGITATDSIPSIFKFNGLSPTQYVDASATSFVMFDLVAEPDSVAENVVAGTITFTLTGVDNIADYENKPIVVVYDVGDGGTSEVCNVVLTGTVYTCTTTGLLGQTTPVSAAAADYNVMDAHVYFGHPDVMFDSIQSTVLKPNSNWTTPDTVVVNGVPPNETITFTLTEANTPGISDHVGDTIIIGSTFWPNDNESVVIAFSAGVYSFTTVGILGQVAGAVSVNVAEYAVKDFWNSPRITGCWEYYTDTENLENPDQVTRYYGPDYILFNLNTLLGTTDRSGALVTVRCTLTGIEKELTVIHGGSNNIVRTNTNGADNWTLGQTAMSASVDDYIVYAEWLPIEVRTDETTSFDYAFNEPGLVLATWTLPQSENREWKKQTVNFYENYWIRFRVITIDSNYDNATFQLGGLLDQNHLYVTWEVSQGKTITQSPIASGLGLPYQAITLAQVPYVEDSLEIYIDEGAGDVTYEIVDSFASSNSTSRHVKISVDSDGYATFKCGDGVNGKMFTPGTNNIWVEYKIGANNNGNVGANILTKNVSGIGYLRGLYNPRQVTGWVRQEGYDSVDLERVKESKPAEALQGSEAGSSPNTIDLILLNDYTYNNSKPIARVKVIEEFPSLKSVSVYLVATGGSAPSPVILADIEEYFNGDGTADEVQRLICNHELEANVTDFETIDVTAIVTGGDATEIARLLTAILSPLALEDDGETYVWPYGGTVTVDRLKAEIFKCTVGTHVTNVNITLPAADVVLTTNQLPKPGTMSITVI